MLQRILLAPAAVLYVALVLIDRDPRAGRRIGAAALTLVFVTVALAVTLR